MGVWREESVVKFQDIIASLRKGLLLKSEVVMSAVVGPIRGKLVGILDCTTSKDFSTECSLYQTNQEQHHHWIHNTTVTVHVVTLCIPKTGHLWLQLAVDIVKARTEYLTSGA